MRPDWVREQEDGAERAEWPLWQRTLSWLARNFMWPIISIALFALAVIVGEAVVGVVRAVVGI